MSALTSQIQYDIHAVQCQPVILHAAIPLRQRTQMYSFQGTIIERNVPSFICFFTQYDIVDFSNDLFSIAVCFVSSEICTLT